ncbi:hypothetical protein H0H93_008097 [Arthromyces matolae]|nr:hypothetical protein H0H93_008097 [Arthromyces matolae]
MSTKVTVKKATARTKRARRRAESRATGDGSSVGLQPVTTGEAEEIASAEARKASTPGGRQGDSPERTDTVTLGVTDVKGSILPKREFDGSSGSESYLSLDRDVTVIPNPMGPRVEPDLTLRPVNWADDYELERTASIERIKSTDIEELPEWREKYPELRQRLGRTVSDTDVPVSIPALSTDPKLLETKSRIEESQEKGRQINEELVRIMKERIAKGSKQNRDFRAGQSTPDAIVCIDACFTQKRNKGSRDPVRIHPRSVFVPESDAERTAHYVESIRPPRSATNKRQRNQDKEDKEDGFEGSLKVPTSVLDACEAGFTAADDARVKASTQFFDDTALMAILCRHDRVLWIVNMRSAGEKQHYVLVLIETLFQHLPLKFTIGLLYDIGCQLERSCINWGFLTCYLHRLLFGISVFHAFGHQWACQIIYHPRKRAGFGLSDGEGCERFWHSISKLIAYLRVCGYHQRIYTLDRQVQQFDKDSLEKLGNWLQQRSRHCSNKREAAKLLLTEASQSEECLRREWAAQVAAQTRPAPKRSKNQGKLAVEKALNLRKARDILEK